jgi:predicted nuclease of predicted toxin-antitoxin system
MPPDWRFLLDRGMNFRTKRELLAIGFATVYQLADVGLTGLALDPEIVAAAQQRRLILITQDTDFLREVGYVIGHDGILWVNQSRTELQDAVTAALPLAAQYPSLANMRFIVHIGGQVSRA